MDSVLESLWFVSVCGKKIVTDALDRYDQPDVVMEVAEGIDVPKEYLIQICNIHNNHVENQWVEEAYQHALGKDD